MWISISKESGLWGELEKEACGTGEGFHVASTGPVGRQVLSESVDQVTLAADPPQEGLGCIGAQMT